MSADTVFVGQRDPVQYRPSVPRGTRNGSHREEGEGTHAREIELKRSRGEISCAECRRLKIKCDRQLPCSSCLRRGCASLCPNGSLATGQGTRFVLAATDHLHRRMSKMSERIRQLEDALAIMQTSVSQEPHPLLLDELLTLKVDKTQESSEAEPSDEIPKGLDGLGTLTISDKGLRFFGASGGSELMFLREEDDERFSSPSVNGGSPASHPSSSSQRDSKSPALEPDVALFSNAFPFTPIGPAREVQAKIESLLPPWEEAVKIAEIYVEHAAWLFRSVPRDQLMDEMLPAIYRRAPPDPAHSNSGDYEGPHALALLLMCFALGTLVDLSKTAFSSEANHFYQLAKAAIVLQNAFERPEVFTIQALHLMSIYNGMRQPDEQDDSETSMEMSWSLIRQSIQLALTIGLHRDSARWGLSSLEVERRRVLFWDLFVADAWQSLATGRPPCITLPFVDCQFPRDEDARLNERGQQEPGFNTWMFRFVCECVGEVAAKTLTAIVPPYSMVLELDAKIRDFHVPAFPDSIPLDPSNPASVLARYALSHSRETILLNLHRSFFAQAMIDDPVNPLRSPFAPSFLATYRSASHILKTVREEFELVPEFSARFWMPWTFAFSSAVVFGTVVLRGPSSSYAPASLQELDTACELFCRAGHYSRRASKASVILQRLKIKAHAAYQSCLGSKNAMSDDAQNNNIQLLRTPKQEKDDELDLFSGRVRLVSSKKGSSSSASPPDAMGGVTPSDSHSPSPPLSFSRPAPPSTVPDNSTFRVSKMRSPISSQANPTSGGLQMHNLSAVRSPDSSSSDSVYPASASWSSASPGHSSAVYRDMYAERSPETSGLAYSATNAYPATVKLDEWVTPSTSRHEQSNSHSSHPEMGGMDGMEYGHSSANVSSHHGYVPHNHSHHLPPIHPHSQPHPQQHPQQHPQHVARDYQPRIPAHMGHEDPRFNAAYPSPPSSGHPGGYYGTSGGTPPELYATAPRELAELGLASQHSGLNQRWTSFMQDSGLFYPQGATM